MIKHNRSLQSIQLIRGVACLLVVLLHITINGQLINGKSIFGNLFSFGGSGVDIFFVLSGFIITYTNYNKIGKTHEALVFIKRRLNRIFPIYWIVISVFLVFQNLLPTFYKTPFVLQAQNLFYTYLLLPGHVMVNGVSWSLTNELYFYLLFVFCILFKWKRTSFILMIIYLIVLFLSSFGAFHFSESNYWIAVLFSPMNIEFILGVIIALVYFKINKKLARPILCLGVLLFSIAIYFQNQNVYLFNSSINRVLYFGFPAALIILGAVVLEHFRKINISIIFLNLGDASYSIYLFHLPIVVAFLKLLNHYNIVSEIIIYCLIVVLVIIIYLAGVIIYKNIETPLLKYFNKKI